MQKYRINAAKSKTTFLKVEVEVKIWEIFYLNKRIKWKCFKNTKLKSNHQFNIQSKFLPPAFIRQEHINRRFAVSLCCAIQLWKCVDGIKINHNLCPLGLKLPAKTSEIQ